jgi:hypothetical protein
LKLWIDTHIDVSYSTEFSFTLKYKFFASIKTQLAFCHNAQPDQSNSLKAS